MIKVEGKELVFTSPAMHVEVFRRKAIFAHICPKCNTVIHGMFEHDGSPIREKYRMPKGNVREINLRMFAQPTPAHNIMPEFISKYVSLADGSQGQYFFDAYHIAKAGLRTHGRCKYMHGIDCFSRNKKVEVLRLLGILKILYGAENSIWDNVKKTLNEVETAGEVVSARILKFAGLAQDVIGAQQPVTLLSKEDWGYGEFGTLLQDIVALQKKEELENV